MDIGKNIEQLEDGSTEQIFYQDQTMNRIHRLSEEIDVDWVQQQEEEVQEQVCEEQMNGEENSDEDEENEEDVADVSLKRSGRICVSTYEAGTQTDECSVPHPKV